MTPPVSQHAAAADMERQIRHDIDASFEAWAASKRSQFHYIIRYLQLILRVVDPEAQKHEIMHLLLTLRAPECRSSSSVLDAEAIRSALDEDRAEGVEVVDYEGDDDVVGSRGQYRLAEENAHPRDARIQFDEASHTYHVDGQKVGISVSGILKKYVPGMDAARVINTYFGRWRRNADDKYHLLIRFFEINMGLTDSAAQKRQIARVWTAAGKDAADKGTYMHAQIERCLNGVAYDATGPEMAQFEAWRASFLPELQLEPFRTEWSVFYTEADLAGQIDSVFRSRVDPDIYIMVDWKRCNPEPYRPGSPPDVLGPHMDVFRNEKCLGICGDMPAHDYSKYCLQQNLYRFMVEENYGIRIARSFLVQFHPYLSGAGHTIEVEPLDALVRKIVDERVSEVSGGCRKRLRRGEEDKENDVAQAAPPKKVKTKIDRIMIVDDDDGSE